MHIHGDKIKIELNLLWMKVDEWKLLVDVLEKRVTHLSPIPLDELHRLYREEKDFTSNWMWRAISFGCIAIAITAQFDNFENFQVESQAYSLPLFVFSTFIAVFIRKKFYSHYLLQIRPNQKKANVYAIGFGLSLFMLLNSIGTFSNQKFDESRPYLRIVNLIKSQESRSHEEENGPCYLLVDDNLKKAYIEHELCHPEFAKAKESSKVIVGYKKGFLGQRWVASIKVIE